MKKISVVGSSNVDYTLYVDSFPRPGETIIASSRARSAGGKGLNQAVAVSRAGSEVCFYSAVGNDADGLYLRGLLQIENLAQNLAMSENETGTATILVDKAGENEISIVKGANESINEWELKDSLSEILSSDILVLQNEIPSATNLYLLSKYQGITIYNPAPFSPFPDCLLRYVTYIIPNERELSLLTGENDYRKGARGLLGHGVKNVIVTLGSKGAYFNNGKEEFSIPSIKSKPIDTVGAGDTFIGYFSSSIAMGLSNLEAIKRANHASSIAVSRRGAMASIPYASEVDK